MIVRQFLQWVRTAPATARADATSALARAYLHSELGPDDRAATEGAMIMLLDDPSPLVRGALAEALAGSRKAPAAVVHALAADHPAIAGIILGRSPLLSDVDLVDRVGSGEPAAQVAIAGRARLGPAVAAALAEVGSAEACLVLIENSSATVPAFSLERIVKRHTHLAAVRDSLLARDDLPSHLRQALVAKLSDTLADYVAAQRWLEAGQARRVAREACEKATVALAATSADGDVGGLVSHLRQSGQLTAALLLRALLSGNVRLFEAALADLSGLPRARIARLLEDRSGKGLRAAFDRAHLPGSVLTAARAALALLRENPTAAERSMALRLKRSLVEGVLAHCQREAAQTGADLGALLMLLRRFAVEAAREEARRLCDDLAGTEGAAAA